MTTPPPFPQEPSGPYGSYGPPPGYGAPQDAAGAASSEDGVWAGLTHLSYFVVPLLVPLVVFLVKKDGGPFVRQHAAEALNFHITLLIGFVVSVVLVLVLIGVLGLIFLAVWGTVLSVVAAVKGFQGQTYRYPATLRLVK